MFFRDISRLEDLLELFKYLNHSNDYYLTNKLVLNISECRILYLREIDICQILLIIFLGKYT